MGEWGNARTALWRIWCGRRTEKKSCQVILTWCSLARAHHLFRPNISSRLSECETHRDYLYGQTYRDDFGRVEIKAAGLSIACRYIKQGLGVSRWYVKSLAQGKVGSLKGQTMVCLQCDEGRWVGKQLSIGTFCRWKLSHVCVVCLLLSDAWQTIAVKLNDL